MSYKVLKWCFAVIWFWIIYSGTPFERPPWQEANPSEKATWHKSDHKCQDLYSWREATHLERPLFWCKRDDLQGRSWVVFDVQAQFCDGA